MLSFMLWSSFATAFGTVPPPLKCDIDLAPLYFGDVAACDSGCVSCNFRLNTNGKSFKWGKIHCLSNVPCRVAVDSNINYAMDSVYVNATHASQLTIVTKGTAAHIWHSATIFAPENGGDFRFEANSQGSVTLTDFYANYSGVVEFIFSDGSSLDAEMYCMKVFAANAQNLSILLGENTKYGSCKSRIECPVSSETHDSACIWKSDASPYNEDTSVDIIAPSGTPQGVSLICENPDACTGVKVHCNEETDVCLMQYSDDSWFCNGTCNTHTSTVAPVQMTTDVKHTSDAPTANSGSQSNGSFLLYVVIFCLCVVIVCGALVFVCRKVCGKQQVASESEVGVANDQQSDMQLTEGIAVIEPGTSTDLELERSPLVIQSLARGRRATDILICEQPEGVPNAVLGPEPYMEQQIEGGSGDSQSSDELLEGAVTHGLDDSEERRDLKGAIHSVDQMNRDEKDVQFGKYLSSVQVGNEILEEDVFDEIDGVEPTRGQK